MKLILQDKNKYVLKAEVDEDVMNAIEVFCTGQRIEAASFFAIGAAKEIHIAWYDLHEMEYVEREIKQELEIISLLGNVAVANEEVIVHAHGSFSDKDMQVMAGHVTKVIVGAACEIVLEKLEGKIEKSYDSETGLRLMT